MSSRASSPPIDDDDDLRGMLDAMGQESPARGPTKRSRGAMLGDDDDTSDKDQPAAPAPPLALGHQNIVMAVKRYTAKKRLRPEQATEVDVFLSEPPSLREAKVFTNLLALENQMSKIIAATPVFEVSPDLKKNINNYAPAVLLSSKTNIYKGDGITNILLAIIKKHRCGIPANTENIPADWAKVVAVVEDALTQKRSKIKKTIGRSLRINSKDKDFAPPPKRQNIFELAQAIIKGSQCSVNVILCARIALMRKVYMKHPGVKFWDKLDDRLVTIRKESGGDANKLIRAFRFALTNDQNTHGIKNYELDDEKDVDEFQQSVDDLIEAGNVDAATSAQGQASAEGEEEA
ncbi:hypothetical protein FB451DRAFT_1534905 [Mycena latifolia]|nr:hypothetical protein FB451DRAFT_1534905 [Mycena latifolia]